jgi:hypothetical protein
MKSIASILTGLSIAVLLFAASAHAQYDGLRMTANVPFDFTVGNVSLPAGQYEFVRTETNIYLVRGENGRSIYTVSTSPIQPNDLPAKSMLRFETVGDRHLLVQIWNDRAATGNEFQYPQNYGQIARQSAIHATVAGHR